MKSEFARHWPLDPSVVFLNHGSFGSCPRAVLDFQHALRDRLERQPVRFLVRELEPMWDEARAAIARFVGAEADDLVFTTNATTGVNTVLRSLIFKPGDELLVTDHEYNACRCALDYAASISGATVVVAEIPFPLNHSAQIESAILDRVTSRTRLVLMDHVTSQTALIMPVAAVARELARRGVELLVDGAHAPGMVPLNIAGLGATYYTGNCHKWLCGPKSAAFLWVRRDRQPFIHPLSMSHGFNSTRTDRSRFLLEFGWMGTTDPTPSLSVAEAVRVVGALVPGGWPEVMERNHRMAAAAQKVICDALQIPPPCLEDCLGSMAAFPIPDCRSNERPVHPPFLDPLQEMLWARHRIEVPVNPWPAFPRRLLRVSAQLYNHPGEYETLAAILRGEFV